MVKIRLVAFVALSALGFNSAVIANGNQAAINSINRCESHGTISRDCLILDRSTGQPHERWVTNGGEGGGVKLGPYQPIVTPWLTVSSSGSPNIADNRGGGGAGQAASPAATQNSQAGQTTCPDNQSNGTAAASPRPVKLSTGEKFLDQIDRADASIDGLPVSRTYRSQLSTGTMFGAHWRSSLDHPVLNTSGPCFVPSGGGCVPYSVRLTLPDGTQYVYALVSNPGGGGGGGGGGGAQLTQLINASTLSALASPVIGVAPALAGKAPALTPQSLTGTYLYRVGGAVATGDLVRSSAGWTLVRNKVTYRYNAGGRLQSISDLAGATTTFTFGTSNQLATVTTPGGKSLTFTWTNSRVSKIRDHAGNEWNYAYDPTSNMLVSVSYPGTPAGSTRPTQPI